MKDNFLFATMTENFLELHVEYTVQFLSSSKGRYTLSTPLRRTSLGRFGVKLFVSNFVEVVQLSSQARVYGVSLTFPIVHYFSF